MALCRFENAGAKEWGWLDGQSMLPLREADVAEILAGRSEAPLTSLRERTARRRELTLLESIPLLPPLDPPGEVWAAGVTYESSKLARMAESAEGGDFYARVYTADRPELFFKANPRRVAGHGETVRIRADSRWNVPEPELGVLLSATRRALGFTVGNDMSSRDIEGANPLYLPQAKVYRGCCALGPWIVPAESLDPLNLKISMTIARGGNSAFEGETTTANMRRGLDDLAEWLFREDTFPLGVVLLTGTGIIPPDDFTLQAEDEIAITIGGIGTLTNRVAVN